MGIVVVSHITSRQTNKQTTLTTTPRREKHLPYKMATATADLVGRVDVSRSWCEMDSLINTDTAKQRAVS